MKIYYPDNFIKNQVLPSHYKGEDIYIKSGDEYTKISSNDLYIKDANNNYLLIGKLNGSYNAVWFASDMDFLNRKLDKSYRQMNIWDFYRIVDTVNEVDEFASKQNSLIELTGLIINCGNFIYNNEAYATGDVVYRTSDGSYKHIPAERGGMFYPSKLWKDPNNNNFTFTYSFIKNAPSGNEVSISPTVSQSGSTWDASGAQNNKIINFERITPSNTTSLYSVIETVNSATRSFTFDAKFVDNVVIPPVIKVYVEDNNEYEEIYCPFTVTRNGSVFTISFEDSLTKLVVIK